MSLVEMMPADRETRIQQQKQRRQTEDKGINLDTTKQKKKTQFSIPGEEHGTSQTDTTVTNTYMYATRRTRRTGLLDVHVMYAVVPRVDVFIVASVVAEVTPLVANKLQHDRLARVVVVAEGLAGLRRGHVVAWNTQRPIAPVLTKAFDGACVWLARLGGVG